MKKYLLFIMIIFISTSLEAQNLLNWNNYLNGNEVSAIVEDSNYIYIGTKEGGVVQVNKSTNENVYFDSSNSGLLGNRISAIAKDSQGNIWFASKAGVEIINGMNGGLAKYDGTSWTNYDSTNSGFDLSNINTITIDDNDVLWIGTGLSSANVGVLTFDGITWTIYDGTNTNLPYYQVNNIAIDNNGIKWISTYGGGLVKYNNNSWEVFNTSNSSIPNNTIYDVDIDSNGVKWIASDDGLIEFDDTTMISHFSGYHIYDVEIDDNDNKWIATWNDEIDPRTNLYVHSGKGIVKFINDSNYINYLPNNSNIPHTDVYSITIANNGKKYIGTGFGLGIFDDFDWQNINPSKFPILKEAGITINLRNHGSFTDMKIDASGNKWFAIEGVGIAKFNNIDWVLYTPITSGLHNRWVNSIAIGNNGYIWYGSHNGIGYYDGSNWFSFTSSNSNFPSDCNNTTVEAIDNNGVVWGKLRNGTTRKGMYKFDGTSFTQYNTSNSGLVSNYISNISVDINNHKWFGNANSLIEFDDTNFTIYNNSNSGLPDERVISIQIDNNGKKWIRSGSGGFFGGQARLVSFDGTSWNSFNSNTEENFSIDHNNNLWFGSRTSGLLEYSGTDASSIMVLNYDNSPIPRLKVSSPKFDDNLIWFYSQSGLSSFVLGPPLLTYVPDDNFEQKLIDLGYDDILDNYVLTNNIKNVTLLEIWSSNISDLTGIEDFTNLEILRCSDNNISSIDLSNNTHLTWLTISNNNLSSIDLSNNSLISTLYLDFNNITDLDLTQNTSLWRFYCRGNGMTSIDLRNGVNTIMDSNYVNFTNNPNLTCIFVDDTNYSSTHWTNIDATANFVETEAECNALSIDDETYKQSITIYPNPTSGILYIKNIDNLPIKEITITNTLGQKIIKSKEVSNLDISDFTSGIYYISIVDAKGNRVSYKLIKG